MIRYTLYTNNGPQYTAAAAHIEDNGWVVLERIELPGSETIPIRGPLGPMAAHSLSFPPNAVISLYAERA